MNKNQFRIVFNHARGLMMAVGEHVKSHSSACGTGSVGKSIDVAKSRDAQHTATVRPLIFSVMLSLGMVGIVPNTLSIHNARADIIADQAASANHRPVIVSAPNGIPLVNIQTPSAAGVSRNTYSQFDVNTNGAILNNSRINVQTQLGGFVQGNPYLAAGTARIILNEVNSQNPSLLNGYIEVAGSRAQVVIANPAGISCDGCGFINASRSTLTTGTPVINGGDLIGYRVTGGIINFLGTGLDASQSNYTDIIARAVNVNAGVFANHLNVITGTNQVNVASAGDISSVVPITPINTVANPVPGYALDVAALGGMYAGKIHMIGTEAGLGVRNAGIMGAGVGEISVSADGLLQNTGSITAKTDIQLNTVALESPGSIAADGNIAIQLTSDYTHTGELQAGGNLNLQTTGDITNQSTILASQLLRLSVQNIENTASGEIVGDATEIHVADTLTNRGLIDGVDTFINADTLTNTETGSIFGDHLAIQVAHLNNNAGAVIAARDRLDIGAANIENRANGLLFSAGGLAIGGSLDSNGEATGLAGSLINDGSTIEALGDATLAVTDLQNLNANLTTQLVVTGTGSFDRFTPRDTGVILDSADYPGAHIGNVNVEWRTAGPYSFREYTRYFGTITSYDTQVLSSTPGQILSGGDMQINGSVLNSDSQIIAGGNLDISGASVQNLNSEGQAITSYSGSAYYYDWDGNDNDYDVDYIGAYNPANTVVTYNLSTSLLESNSTSTGSGTSIASAAVPIVTSSLFQANPDVDATYLIETNPRFANYRTWLSSDYMLQQLSLDPTMTQKRLGDGFYEQRLIREQVAQLTGQRFLTGYASDEVQYQALMASAVTQVNALQLIPGVALTAAQVAQLTSDIVWLVEQTVTLPDGTVTQALVPQVYVQLQAGDLHPSTGIMAGNSVTMNLSGDATNQGTIASRSFLALNADNIHNMGGQIAADTTLLTAANDINNIGGQIVAKDALILNAGNDITLASTTQSSSNSQGASSFSRTNLDRVAGLYVSNPDAILVANAGNDIHLMAAAIQNSGAGSQTVINAGQDINLGTVTIAEQNSSIRNTKNFVKHGGTQEIGSVIETTGDITFNAGNDFNARAASVNSESGAIAVIATNDITIEAGRETSNFDTARKVKKSGTFSSTTKERRDTFRADNSISSSFSGDSVNLQAGNDMAISGSHVVSDNGTALQAGHNIDIAAAEDTAYELHERKTKKSGLSASGTSISLGTQQLNTKQTGDSTSHTASTVGSVAGNVVIEAGKAYTQTGSDVLAPQGDISISAQSVDINAALNTNVSTQETKFKQSGISLSISNPVINAIQTAQHMKEAASNTSDGRMQALAAGTTALATKNAYDAVQTAQAKPTTGNAVEDAANQAGGVNLSISIGSSKSSSTSTQTSSMAQGSKVMAGNDVNITATGAGTESDINVIGSQIKAGNDVTLKAEDQINLIAAKNTESLNSKNKNSSASVGISIGTSGLAVTASASKGKGKANGNDVTWTETQVEAGNKVTLESGTDTNLIGAQVRGNQVVADVGTSGEGNLNIQSLQDTSTYDSKQKSTGISVSVPVGAGMAGGSFSSSSSKINSDYASVNEQAGIFAGDEGFQINVAGNTNLTGAVIASTEHAIQDNKNSLTTETLTVSDIQNSAEYEAKGSSATIGGGLQAGLPQLSGAGIGSDSDKTDSVTVSAISQGIVNVTNNDAQQTLTGTDANITVALLNRDVHVNEQGEAVDSQGNSTANTITPIFDAEKVAKEIQAQVQITEAFGQQAHQAISIYTATQLKELQGQLKSTNDEKERQEIQSQIDQTLLAERTLNVLVGIVTGMGSTAITKETLEMAADKFRELTLENSSLFAGAVDDHGVLLSNLSGDSAGMNQDGTKLGGIRVDLDLLCGAGYDRCAHHVDGDGKIVLDLNSEGNVLFKGDFSKFLQTDEGKKMAGPTGGVQGYKGALFGISYKAGDWMDQLIEAFAGTHDYLGGQLTGLYDEQGNIRQGMSDSERWVYDNLVTTTAIPIAAPFAAAQGLSPDVWNAISILLNSGGK